MDPINLSVLRVIQNTINKGDVIGIDSHPIIVKQVLEQCGPIDMFELSKLNKFTGQVLNMFWNYPTHQVVDYIKDTIKKYSQEMQICVD